MQINIPVWLNADILPGPGSHDEMIGAAREILGIEEEQDEESIIPWSSIMPRLLPADEFLQIVAESFPDATLSTGWTTGEPAEGEAYAYTQEQIDQVDASYKIEAHLDYVTQAVSFLVPNLKMLATLEANRVGSQPVTFPVRAMFVGESQAVLESLLAGSDAQGRVSTLTMWGTDPIEVNTHGLTKRGLNKGAVSIVSIIYCRTWIS